MITTLTAAHILDINISFNSALCVDIIRLLFDNSITIKILYYENAKAPEFQYISVL